MQYLDQLLPLIALACVGGLLLYLLRLANVERASQASVEIPVPVAAPLVVPVATPVVVEVAKVETPPVDTPVIVLAAPARTPVHNVLDLLNSKDTLTTAFLLNEILGPPVSRRRKPV
jgi:hypothetical protein